MRTLMCDRCGRQLLECEPRFSCVAENMIQFVGMPVLDGYDLCKSCGRDFVKWVAIGVKEDE